ncbi:MAG: exo-alpha-sialidase, partial [Planctomycetota bacterium]
MTLDSRWKTINLMGWRSACVFGWLLVGALSSRQASSEQYALQPLKYNNPGLVVDLGVGLWAYPMPLDYDDDGDMDLLVGCPDKPSQGVYFFENPTQDGKNPDPVFKPAVRVGNAGHYMMLSQKGDQKVILQQNNEFVRDPATGLFDFAKPRTIRLPVRPKSLSSGRTRAVMWRYVDYESDGDHDLAIGIGDWSDYGWDHAYDRNGQWRNGPLHGYVYLVLNEGDDQKPIYSSEPFRLQAGGGDVDVYGWPSPNFADFDGDGDLDLLCGEFLDGFTYFQNVGTRNAPKYAAGHRLTSEGGEALTMHLQMITPTAVDWDGDGVWDLIVGDEDGRVALVENTGRLERGVPVFREPHYLRQEADTLKFGALATPHAYDGDGDGDEDIFCGNTAGSIGYFENIGTSADGLPIWEAPKLITVSQEQDSSIPFRVMAGPSGSIQGPCEAKWGYTTLSVADLNRDGLGDIVYNSIHGQLGCLFGGKGNFRNVPWEPFDPEMPPAWSWQQAPTAGTVTQWRTTPLLLDFDEDGDLDLVMLDQEGYLTLRSAFGEAERVFVDESHQPLRLNPGTCGRSGRVKLAMTDWDGDGRTDLLVNSENATWYRNCETRNGSFVMKRVGNLAQRNVAGHTSSPAVCDFDADRKPDLLVGSENGRIYHIRHQDCVSFGPDETHSNQPLAPESTRIPGLVTEEFVYTKAPFKQCHASTICETSRGLVAAWFGGTREKNPDVAIWTSYHDGLKWNGPTKVADGVQHDGLRYPCWNPVLFQPPGDAPTLLFFKVGPSPREWWGELMVSYDRGRTFRDRVRLPEGIDGPVRSKPILLPDGQTLLCGSSTESDGWRVHFESVRLVDGVPGSTWKRIGPIEGADKYQAIQPTFLRHRDGRLQVLCRTREGVIASAESDGSMAKWTGLEGTDLPNPNSGIEAVTLDDGRHLLVYNHLG